MNEFKKKIALVEGKRKVIHVKFILTKLTLVTFNIELVTFSVKLPYLLNPKKTLSVEAPKRPC